MIGIFSAEWLKIRSMPSTYYILGIAFGSVILAAVTAWNAVAIWDSLTAAQRDHFMLAPLEKLSSWIASLCLAVFGVIAITSEYASGTIHATLVSVPNRQGVFAAKAAMVLAVGLVSGVAVSFGTIFATELVIGSHPVANQMMRASDKLPELGAMSLTIATFALLGLGLGTITRSTAGSIGIIVALWYLLPMLAQDLPLPWNDAIGSVMLGALPGQLVGSGNENSVYGAALSPLGAVIAMMFYAVGPLGAGVVLFARRDA